MNLDKMWERLAAHQPFADRRGYGPAWAAMCAERTEAAAWEAAAAVAEEAADAAWVAAQAAEAAAQAAAWAAWAAAQAAEAAAQAVRWIKRSEGEK